MRPPLDARDGDATFPSRVAGAGHRPPSAHMGGIAQSATVTFRTGLLAATRDKFEKHGFAAFDYTKPAAPLHMARPLGIDGDKAGLMINPRSLR